MIDNILIYDLSNKTLTGPKPLGTIFDNVDGVITIYHGTKDFTLFDSEKHGTIWNKIRYLVSLKTSIKYAFSHYYAKIKVILMILYLHKKYWLYIKLNFSLNKLLIKTKVITIKIYS